MKVCLNLPGPIPPVLSMSTCKLKIGLRKVKIFRFGSACNGFDATFLHSLLSRVKVTGSITLARQECNEYDLTAGPSF
jgi:hypothetical protein